MAVQTSAKAALPTETGRTVYARRVPEDTVLYGVVSDELAGESPAKGVDFGTSTRHHSGRVAVRLPRAAHAWPKRSESRSQRFFSAHEREAERRFDRLVSRFAQTSTPLYAATSDLLAQRPQLAARFAANLLARAAFRAVSSSIGILAPSP